MARKNVSTHDIRLRDHIIWVQASSNIALQSTLVMRLT